MFRKKGIAMEMRHLRLIKSIVEEGGITKATDKLHLTQSALSHQLKEAECQLGTKIFLRVNKKLVLTGAGKKLYPLANEILAKLEETETQIREMIHGETGEIRISTECYTSYHWLPALMRQFNLLYPKVELRIVVEATHQPIQKLLAGDLDIAVTSDPVKNNQIKYVKLFQDEMFAIVPASHKWTNKDYVEARDFIDQNLIIHSLPMETVSVYQFVLAPENISPKKVIILPLTEASIEMVKAKMGIFVAANWILEPYLKSSTLKKIKIGPKGLRRTHFIAVLKSRQFPNYFNQFIEFMQREIVLV